MQTLKSMRVRTVAVAAAMAATGAYAVEIETDNPDWSIRFDNTVKGGLIYRTQNADPALVDSFRPGTTFPQASNFNAGDDNFRKRGFVSKRVDLLSELDLVYQRSFGARLSGAAWYDAAYRGKTDATDTFNGQSPYNEFPEKTRQLAGRKAEVLDAFVFGGFDLGEGVKLTTRLGRHALQYGESLFYGDNGIARAQGPVDIFKLLSSPNAQFKEIIRPVPQVSAQLQFSPNLSVGGYYQFRWEADRLPPSGSYFSTANIPWGSGQAETANLGGLYVFRPGTDIEPKDSGQFGLQLKWRVAETDLGFYAARYHDKGGQLYGQLGAAPAGPIPGSGSWFYAFGDNVKTYGVSVSHSLGDVNLAGEASIRDDVPLRSDNMFYGFFPGQPRPQYATGRTAHINLSTITSFSPNFLARESSLVGEIAWNRLLHADDPDHRLDHGRTRDATAIQLIFTPSYRQALPGLDLNVPIGLRYTVDGQSSVTVWDARKAGSFNIGLDGNYLGVWQFTLAYTHYIGKAEPFVDYSPLLTGGSPIYGQGNPLADRNNIALTVRRTF